MQTLADFKRELTPGLSIVRTFLENDQIVGMQRRVVSSVTSGGFCTRDEELGTVSEMRFGRAAQWEFDNYIAGWAALWTDPEDATYQVQYKYVESGF